MIPHLFDLKNAKETIPKDQLEDFIAEQQFLKSI
jgi:hypothetical protein